MADNEPSAAGTPPANNPPAGGDTQQQQTPAAGQQQPPQGRPNAAQGAGNPGVPGSGSGPKKFSRREIQEKSKTLA